MILQLFDDFLTDLPSTPILPTSTSSYLTITLAALVDESVDVLVLSLEVNVHHHDYHLTAITTAITTNPDSTLPGSCYRLSTL